MSSSVAKALREHRAGQDICQMLMTDGLRTRVEGDTVCVLIGSGHYRHSYITRYTGITQYTPTECTRGRLLDWEYWFNPRHQDLAEFQDVLRLYAAMDRLVVGCPPAEMHKLASALMEVWNTGSVGSLKLVMGSVSRVSARKQFEPGTPVNPHKELI